MYICSVRDLGLLLAQQYSSGAKPNEVEVSLLQEHMLDVRSNFERCSEHVSTGITTLEHFLSPTPSGESIGIGT